MRVMVVGAGYVGLTAAVVISSIHQVTVVETDAKKVKSINLGKPPFYEKDMESMLKESIANGRLHAIEPRKEYSHHDFVILCVGTPPTEDGSVNLDYLKAAVENISNAFSSLTDDYLVIAVRSTIPPGTTRRIVLEPLLEIHDTESFGVVFNPEFLKQGTAIDDITGPARVVIGASSPKAGKRYRELYSSILQTQDAQILELSMESAELCKYASNCFLATKVSFANEISSIAERLPHVDIDDVMDAVVADNRIHPSHMRAGLGFGGTCLPKDLSGLVQFGKDLGLSVDLLSAVDRVNEKTSDRLMELLNGRVHDLHERKVCVLGLTFKAKTDDTRASQSLNLIRKLYDSGAKVWVHDPMANESTLPKDIKGMFHRCEDVRKCTEKATAVFLMTDWPVYKDIGIQEIVSQMEHKLVIDGRRLFARSIIPAGVEYLALGSKAQNE